MELRRFGQSPFCKRRAHRKDKCPVQASVLFDRLLGVRQGAANRGFHYVRRKAMPE